LVGIEPLRDIFALRPRGGQTCSLRRYREHTLRIGARVGYVYHARWTYALVGPYGVHALGQCGGTWGHGGCALVDVRAREAVATKSRFASAIVTRSKVGAVSVGRTVSPSEIEAGLRVHALVDVRAAIAVAVETNIALTSITSVTIDARGVLGTLDATIAFVHVFAHVPISYVARVARAVDAEVGCGTCCEFRTYSDGRVLTIAVVDQRAVITVAHVTLRAFAKESGQCVGAHRVGGTRLGGGGGFGTFVDIDARVPVALVPGEARATDTRVQGRT